MVMGNIALSPYNQTLITLLLNTKCPTSPLDWYLISICNTIYKILSKLFL